MNATIEKLNPPRHTARPITFDGFGEATYGPPIEIPSRNPEEITIPPEVDGYLVQTKLDPVVIQIDGTPYELVPPGLPGFKETYGFYILPGGKKGDPIKEPGIEYETRHGNKLRVPWKSHVITEVT